MSKKVTIFYNNKAVKHGRKKIIFAMYGNRCSYCLEQFPVEELTIDHIIPRHKGGKNTWQNYTPACRVCNGEKHGDMLDEERLVYLRRKAERFYETFLAENVLVLNKGGKIYVFKPYKPYTEERQRQQG